MLFRLPLFSMRRLSILSTLVLLPYLAVAQHQDVFPQLTGDELLQAVQDAFTPETVMTYSMARDTLFKNVYAVDDSLECVYTGWKRYLDPSLDPTQAVFTDNGGDLDINTEHCYPQSKGAKSGNGRSDMHHLFPTRASVNSERANDPFMEIPDSQTSKWFYRDQTLTSEPTSMKDAYAEDIQKGFEPREEVKGNIARAVFYFYTIYRDNAVSAAPEFFEIQKATLCSWHYKDPVDPIEWDRTYKIAKYQDDKPNPFILDCSLSTRMYCAEFELDNCVILDIEESDIEDVMWTIYPNPGKNVVSITADKSWTGIQLFTLRGKYVDTFELRNQGGRQSARIEGQFTNGVYLVRLYDHRTRSYSQFQKWTKY